MDHLLIGQDLQFPSQVEVLHQQDNKVRLAEHQPHWADNSSAKAQRKNSFCNFSTSQKMCAMYYQSNGPFHDILVKFNFHLQADDFWYDTTTSSDTIPPQSATIKKEASDVARCEGYSSSSLCSSRHSFENKINSGCRREEGSNGTRWDQWTTCSSTVCRFSSQHTINFIIAQQ